MIVTDLDFLISNMSESKPNPYQAIDAHIEKLLNADAIRSRVNAILFGQACLACHHMNEWLKRYQKHSHYTCTLLKSVVEDTDVSFVIERTGYPTYSFHNNLTLGHGFSGKGDDYSCSSELSYRENDSGNAWHDIHIKIQIDEKLCCYLKTSDEIELQSLLMRAIFTP